MIKTKIISDNNTVTAKMVASCGWRADIFKNGWVHIVDVAGKLISIHSEDISGAFVVDKYIKDGWKLVTEGGDITMAKTDKIIRYCFKCKKKVEAVDVKEVKMKNGRPMTQGKCKICGTKVCQIGSLKK